MLLQVLRTPAHILCPVRRVQPLVFPWFMLRRVRVDDVAVLVQLCVLACPVPLCGAGCAVYEAVQTTY